MSKDKKNTKENENVEETVNETVETVETVEDNRTPEQIKAQQVLRAKLPALSELNFNFEKRTGNVFTASIVKVFDEDGNPVLENGEHKEKLTRKVVEIENEDGELLPDFEVIRDELAAKRAAAFVLGFDALKGKLHKRFADLHDELNKIEAQRSRMETDLETSNSIVMDITLPERAARVNVSAKLTAATDQLAKMRNMLLAAGLSEEEISEQLNG